MPKKSLNFSWSTGLGGAAPAGDLNFFSVEPYAQMLRMVEAAGVDFAVLSETKRPSLSPIVVASAVSQFVPKLGLVPELRVADYPPFKVARLIGTLVHLTQGRAGWAIDLSQEHAMAFHAQASDNPVSIEVAEEFIEVCNRLWTSWAPGALLQDGDAGIFGDASKVSPIHHKGDHFRVRGPLNLMLEPHGLPLLVRRVTSPADYALAARYADVALLSGVLREELPAATAALRKGAIAAGRRDGALRIFASVSLQVAETASGAAAWSRAPSDVINLQGNYEDLAVDLLTLAESSDCDGIDICASWVPREVSAICNNVLGQMKHKGIIARRFSEAGLRHSVMG